MRADRLPQIEKGGVDMPDHGVHIDPARVKAGDYEAACRVLAGCIRRALEDPQKAADFRAWKARREGGKDGA